MVTGHLHSHVHILNWMGLCCMLVFSCRNFQMMWQQAHCPSWVRNNDRIDCQPGATESEGSTFFFISSKRNVQTEHMTAWVVLRGRELRLVQHIDKMSKLISTIIIKKKNYLWHISYTNAFESVFKKGQYEHEVGKRTEPYLEYIYINNTYTYESQRQLIAMV